VSKNGTDGTNTNRLSVYRAAKVTTIEDQSFSVFKLLSWDIRSFFIYVVLFLVTPLPAEEPSRSAWDFFEREVRPLLSEHCYSCHSSRAKKVQANLLLDSRARMLRGGDSGPALVPGAPERSLLMSAIRHEGYEMPPQGKLSDETISRFSRWIELGAPWPDEPEPSTDRKTVTEFNLAERKEKHWSWRPVENPRTPTPSTDWCRDPLDQFIWEKLQEQGLRPAPSIDRYGLIRRLCYDLTGLPPTVEEIDRFVRDSDPRAVESLVDRLLASPRFGERWGRHWLDLVRYAESRGHEFDEDSTHAFHYRDYVIRTLNEDIPYHQWVREHVAGDLLSSPRLGPNGENESILGTGFWYLGEWVHSPVDTRKDEAERFDNMIDVMSKTFLGLTVSCARCHDHKFDAISTRDYYSLTGFLRSSEYRQVRFETIEQDRQIAHQLAQIDDRNQAKVREFLGALWERFLKDPETSRSILQRWESAKNVGLANPVATLKTSERSPAVTRSIIDFQLGPKFDVLQDGFAFGSVFAGEVTLDRQLKIADRNAVVYNPAWQRLENVQENVVNVKNRVKDNRSSGRTYRTKTFELRSGVVSCQVRGVGTIIACVDSHRLVAGPLHGETIQDFNSPKEIRWIQLNLHRYVGHRLHVEFAADHKTEQLEILAVLDGMPFVETSEVDTLQVASPPSIAELRAAVSQWRQGQVPLDDSTVAAIRWLYEQGMHDCSESERAWLDRCAADWGTEREMILERMQRRSRTAMAMWEGSGEEGSIAIRGNPSVIGAEVPRRFLEAIDGPEPLPIASGSGRLELAQRINSATSLTARVIVNRLWHHLLGRGIVATVDDFGPMGQEPTHHELLDHLTWRFLESGESLKEMIRTIVCSATYQMSSRADPHAMVKDPENRYWHHYSLHRLPGEVIRDALLAVSGRLQESQGITSIPVHLTEFMQGRGRPDHSGPLDGDGRRSIYGSVRRNFLSPFLLAFDTPVPFSTMGRRNVANVPAQSLILMNDPFVLDRVRGWAERILAEKELHLESRIDTMYLTAFARHINPEELDLAVQFIRDQTRKSGRSLDDLQTWTDFAHALVNVKEFIWLR
jgi:hypothetical protein